MSFLEMFTESLTESLQKMDGKIASELGKITNLDKKKEKLLNYMGTSSKMSQKEKLLRAQIPGMNAQKLEKLIWNMVLSAEKLYTTSGKASNKEHDSGRVTEATKITTKAQEKILNEIENILGSGYNVEVEDYEGKDPIFFIDPVLSKEQSLEVKKIILDKTKRKKYRVLERQHPDYTSFAIKA